MRIAFITPNLSTGGMPEYVRRSIELLDRESNEILLIEMRTETVLDAVRKRVLDLEGIELFSADKSPVRAIEKIQEFLPDIIHFTEPSEQVISPSYLYLLYHDQRTWKIFETCHDSSYPVQSKEFLPDKFLLVSPFQVKMMQELGVPAELVQYDVPPLEKMNKESQLTKLGLDPNKKHVFQFGIFSPRKNQKETIEIAKMMQDESIQFHFVGNTADSYSYFWKPLLDNLPKNCKFWGEHKNVQQFYTVADMVIFPSIELIDDKETNPLVIKEAIEYEIPLLLKNTPVYLGMYPEGEKVKYMKDTPFQNANIISKMLGLKQKDNMIKVTFYKEDNKLEVTSEQAIGKVMVSVKDIDSEVAIYAFDANFEGPNQTWWCKPIPLEHYDFWNNPNFTGFLVEVYKEDKETFIDKVEIRLKDSIKKRKIAGLTNFEPLFVNYEQFFTDKIYDNFFRGERITTAIDIGANVGLFTQWVLDRFGEDTKIASVEPNPEAIKSFKRTHGEKINVRLFEGAVSSTDGDLELGVNPQNSLISSVHTNKEWSKNTDTIKVKAFTLSSIMEQMKWNAIDLFKMDIEGGEYDIIKNLENFPFRFILIEFHDTGNREDFEELVRKLETSGYELDIRKEDTRYQATEQDNKGIIIGTKKK
jgi:FkbM family methyltransferase